METRAQRFLKSASFMESLMLNGFSVNANNDPNATIIWSRFDEFKHEFEDKGGIIAFSTEVNATRDKGNSIVSKLKAWVKGKTQSIGNKLNLNNKIDKVAKKFEDVQAFTVGNFVKGRYKDTDTGKIWNETSTSLEVIGIDSKTLSSLASEIAKEFNQQTVLVKDYQTGKIYLTD